MSKKHTSGGIGFFSSKPHSSKSDKKLHSTVTFFDHGKTTGKRHTSTIGGIAIGSSSKGKKNNLW